MDPDRRSALSRTGAFLWSLSAAAAPPVRAAEERAPLRMGLASLVPSERPADAGAWREYLETRLARRVQWSRQANYRETMDLLKARQMDFAWVAVLPYVYLARRGYARLVATPVHAGRATDQALLVVRADDESTAGIADLHDRIFAYSDPYSLSGAVLPREALRRAGHDPDRFFRRTFYAGSDRSVLAAVAAGLADAGSVNAFAWDALVAHRPELARGVRVAWRSPEFGLAPVVAGRAASETDALALQHALVGMRDDVEGARILAAFGLDGFVVGQADWYASAAALVREANEP